MAKADNNDTFGQDHRDLIETFAELFQTKIGDGVRTAGAAISAQYLSGAELRAFCIKDRGLVIADITNPTQGIGVRLAGRMPMSFKNDLSNIAPVPAFYYSPQGLIEAFGPSGALVAMLRDVSAELRAQPVKKSGLEREAAYHGQPKEQAKPEAGAKPSFDKMAARDRSGGSKAKTLEKLLYDALDGNGGDNRRGGNPQRSKVGKAGPKPGHRHSR